MERLVTEDFLEEFRESLDHLCIAELMRHMVGYEGLSWTSEPDPDLAEFYKQKAIACELYIKERKAQQLLLGE